MKITMLGTSGSGKTVYMSAMSELFYNGSVDGYALYNRTSETSEDNYISTTFINKKFDNINTLYRKGDFPEGTSSSVFMPLELRYNREHVLPIDWIDYRGGALKELANGDMGGTNAEIYATLLASDVILIFIDAVILKMIDNIYILRSKVGANEISTLLNMINEKKHINVIFLLSKADASIIDLKNDYETLKKKVGNIYSRFLVSNNTQISNYHVIPVGALGPGNVQTSCDWKDQDNEKVLVSKNTISNYGAMSPFNVASSFSIALLLCLENEKNRLKDEITSVSKELQQLQHKFGALKNLFDLLFNGSRRREHIFDLNHIIINNREEIMRLEAHKNNLQKIAKNNL